MKRKSNITNARWLWISAVVILLDQATKILANHYLSFATPVKILPFFNLTLVYNTGAAFSFLQHAGGWQQGLFAAIAILVSIILLVWLLRLPHKMGLAICGITLIFGGAMGNLWDRLYRGYVIDFLDFYFKQYHWPVFNIADSAIVIGASLLILDLLLNPKGD